MSNTNMNENERYNVNDAWPIDVPKDEEDCLKKLVILSHSGKKIECHGASKLIHNGQSTLLSKFDDRFSQNDKNKTFGEKVQEKILIEYFREKAFSFLRQRLANLLMLLV